MKLSSIGISLLVMSCAINISQAQPKKSASIVTEIKKRVETFLLELGTTAEDVQYKIQEFKITHPEKAEMLEQIKEQIDALKTKLETMDYESSRAELQAYFTPERINKVKKKFMIIRDQMQTIHQKSVPDLQEWSQAVVADSELWL